MVRLQRAVGISVATLLCAWSLFGQAPTPKEALGFNLGDDYQVANYTQLEAYWKKLAAESDRMKLVDIGATAEGRRQVMAIVSSPENLRNLDKYKDIARRLALAEGLTEGQARALASEGKAVVWIDGGLHASETVGSQQLMEMVYRMASGTDPETMRFLNDTIQLYVPADPDGQELVANWYMRLADPLKRSLNGVPRLYQKYVGHDDNRDFYMSNMPETTNMNRQMFLEWFPQIVYNHHQTGPAGAVVFIPPFRDPFNYNLDPLIPLSIEMVGSAMHSRLVEEGKGGSVMRSGSNYSTWWNGGLRTIAYFHNMVGILTEIIGGPTPVEIPLVPDQQLPKSDEPLPIAPQRWHYRQSIDYEISQNRAVLDYASRYRETLLFNIYRMGMNSIERGSRDSWTVTPKRIEALRAASSGRSFAASLYDTVLHDPKYRDPRGYIIPANQDDFPTAVEFVNALLKTGITVLRSTAEFQVLGKSYPAGSFVIKTAQAFRPHVLDMFEPQDHPHDVRYPGGPPVPPYDITGWTLALQMGIKFDRILDGFDGPFAKVSGVLTPPAGMIQGPAQPAGYLISHRINNSFILVNRLLKAGSEVDWLERDGTIWVPGSPAARAILEKGAAELGVPVEASSSRPAAGMIKLKPARIGLYDQYGGLAPAGWTRWLFERFEFPFELVYPQTLDAGNLKSKYDVLVLTDGAFQKGARGSGSQPAPSSIPAEYRGWLGRVTEEKTVPRLKQFVEAGGSLVTIGSSTSLAELLGVPVTEPLAGLSREQFYVPGSLMRVTIDTKSDTPNPLTFGMGPDAVVFFDSSPVFKLDADVQRVAWFAEKEPLASGWAWGQEYLQGSTAVAEAKVGAGRVVLLGPEVAFRAQPHGTFKLLFNALY